MNKLLNPFSTVSNDIYITPRVYGDYLRTVGNLEPETFAILGGHLGEADNVVTEIYFCPPMKDENGQYLSSGAHITIDNDLLNYVVLNAWEPNGLYVLGVWHSHPPGVTRLSGDYGDIGSFRSCLATEAAQEKGWNKFLCPITTFDHNGDDMIHGWVYDGQRDAVQKANLYIRHEGEDFTPAEFKDFCAEPTETINTYVAENCDPEFSGRVKAVLEAASFRYAVWSTRSKLKQVEGLSWWHRRRMINEFNRDVRGLR